VSGDFWRARGDLNPRSPAPKASALIQTRLRAQKEDYPESNKKDSEILKNG
jgi:hypothetical protein